VVLQQALDHGLVGQALTRQVVLTLLGKCWDAEAEEQQAEGRQPAQSMVHWFHARHLMSLASNLGKIKERHGFPAI
jgi:hypothetical protein